MIEIRDLGLIAYERAYELQRRYVEKVVVNRGQNYLLICEHPLVLTLGRLADRKHIVCPENRIEGSGISIVPVDRGGDVTLHAPGQLIAYPILNLENFDKDLHQYLFRLEQVGIDFLRLFDIVGVRVSGKTGVWIDGRKIMSIGVGVRKWVSYHGIGLNINTDLALFQMIRPCGMDVVMTSLEHETGSGIYLDQAKEMFIRVFKEEFKV